MINKHHESNNDKQDYHYIATQINGSFNQRAHLIKANDEEARNSIIEKYANQTDTNVYSTPQSYYITEDESRTENNIAYLKRLVIDLDIDFKHFKDSTNTLQEANRGLQSFKSFLVKEMYANVFNKTVEPSSVLDSGIGLHVRIDLDNETNLKLYAEISHYIANEMDELFRDLEVNALVKVDKSKLGANNFFRLEGTTNTKNGMRAKVITENGHIYTFNELIEDHFIDFEEYIQTKEKIESLTNDFKPSNKAWTIETYAEGLIEDLKRVQRNLNRAEITEGHRYMLLHIYSNTIRITDHDTRSLYYKLNHFNQGYIKPLNNAEVNQVYRRIISKRETERIPKDYIIRLFNITYQEQRNMKILVGQAIKQERKNSKRKNDREILKRRRNREKELQTLQIIKLHNEGYTQRAIAKELKISVGTVNQRIRAVKEAKGNE